MATIQEALPITLVHEGGSEYTNIPGDSGGPTKYGVTIHTLSAWRKTECTEDDVKNLTLEEATAIYKAAYWDVLHCDDIENQGVAQKMFDIIVNMGCMPPRHGGEVIQKAVVACGQGIRVDGSPGSKTLAAVNECDGDELMKALATAAANRYHERVTEKPDQQKFLTGWLVRAACTLNTPCRTCRARLPKG